jgi:hypothetical protein
MGSLRRSEKCTDIKTFVGRQQRRMLVGDAQRRRASTVNSTALPYQVIDHHYEYASSPLRSSSSFQSLLTSDVSIN